MPRPNSRPTPSTTDMALVPRFRPLTLTAMTLAGLAALSGCKNEDPGSLLVTYRLGNDRSCAEAGVQEIRVVLDEDNGIENSAPCAEGTVELLGLPIGTYNVDVTGIDENGVVIMDNVKDGVTKVTVKGDGKELTPPEIALTDAPAKLQLRWDFGFTSCENAGIEAFEIEAFDDSGSENLLAAELTCTAQPDTSDGYRAVPDPERQLNGRRLGEVGIQPLDSSGAPVGDRLIFTLEPPSPGYTVSLTMECDETGCSSATNMPD